LSKENNSEKWRGSGLFLGSEPIYDVHDRRKSASGDDDSKDSDKADDDSADTDKADDDSGDSDRGDSDSTDKLDRGDSRDSDGRD
jgi:hypothetical protein